MTQASIEDHIARSIKKVTHQYYVEKVSQGYEFRENVHLGEVRMTIEKYESRGLEVFAGQVAFLEIGKPIPSNWKMRAIFTRRKN